MADGLLEFVQGLLVLSQVFSDSEQQLTSG